MTAGKHVWVGAKVSNPPSHGERSVTSVVRAVTKVCLEGAEALSNHVYLTGIPVTHEAWVSAMLAAKHATLKT